MKKRLVLALVSGMVRSMMPTALAAGDTYQYEIYQIFTGDYDNTAKVLTNIVWGQNGTGTAGDEVDAAILEELEVVNTSTATDAEKLAVIRKYANLTSTPFGTHSTDSTTFTLSGVTNGYYLIKDKSGTQEGDNKSYTTYIVKVVNGSIVINRKADNIVPDKEIKLDDYNDTLGTDDSIAPDGEFNNVGVGNKIDFELTVKLPENADDYSYYYCVLNDTMSSGLTFLPDSVVVTVDGVALTKDTDYILYTGTDTTHNQYGEHYTFQIAMLDAKSLAGKTIVATYQAYLNKDAVIGVDGNPNTFTVKYSNDPNYNYDDINHNGRPDVADDVPIGETPEYKTVTYTTGLKLIKVDEQGNILPSAVFTIEGDSIKYTLVSQDTFLPETATNPGNYWKLNNNTYTTTAPRTADSYIAAEPGATAGYVQVDGAWVEYNETLHVGLPIYIKLLANADEYVSNGDGTFPKFYKKTEMHIRGDNANELPAELPVAADGTVYVTGLGEGVYTIKEKVVPAGYNKIDDITLTIDWEAPANPGDTDCTWNVQATVEGGTTTLNMNGENVFELTIVNRAGSNLPETGGMGTTLFYIVGGFMILAAVVLLITKKRMIAA